MIDRTLPVQIHASHHATHVRPSFPELLSPARPPFQALRVHRGFTLVELLVVISIIALLIAILLPVLANARRSARILTCLSNNRQIGQLFAMYASESKGWTPDYSVQWSAGGWQPIPQSTSAFSMASRRAGYAVVLAQRYLGVDAGAANTQKTPGLKLFKCPLEYDASPLYAELSYVGNFTQGSQNDGNMGIDIYSSTKNAVMSNLDRYAKPSSYFFLLEGNNSPNLVAAGYSYGQYFNYNSYFSFRYRQRVWIRSTAHGGDDTFDPATKSWVYARNYGSSSVLFADMHAKTMSASALGLPGDNPGGTATTDNWSLNASAKIRIPLPD